MSLAHLGKISRQKLLYSERISKDGYIEIKVYHKDYTTAYSKNIAKCGTKWIQKYHKIWIDNYGDITRRFIDDTPLSTTNKTE